MSSHAELVRNGEVWLTQAWGDYFNLSGELSYTWHDVNSSGPAATHSEITWYETWAAFGPVLRYGPWRASFGAYYQNLAGDETDSNPGRDIVLR